MEIKFNLSIPTKNENILHTLIAHHQRPMTCAVCTVHRAHARKHTYGIFALSIDFMQFSNNNLEIAMHFRRIDGQNDDARKNEAREQQPAIRWKIVHVFNCLCAQLSVGTMPLNDSNYCEHFIYAILDLSYKRIVHNVKCVTANKLNVKPIPSRKSIFIRNTNLRSITGQNIQFLGSNICKSWDVWDNLRE